VSARSFRHHDFFCNRDETTHFTLGDIANQVLETSWTSTVGFSSVSITAGVGTDGGAITAFLTTAVGPEEDGADVVATDTFTPGGVGPETDTLFSGLTLGPGTYFLVLSSPDALWYGNQSAPSPTTAAGVTFNGQGVANDTTSGAKPPGNTFTANTNDSLFADVTGTAVPEPGSIGLVLAGGLAGLWLWKRSLPA
jgi:hypothetical protein